MPAETFQERVKEINRLYGKDLQIYGYNRDRLAQEGDEIPPFNTPDGEQWLWREIGRINPDLIVFDSIMCLTAGELGDEKAWLIIKPLIRKITSRRIAQIWLHHTGHNKDQSFGTKTREWEMDTVIILNKPDDDVEAGCIELRFNKARLRMRHDDPDFANIRIARREDGWRRMGEATSKPGKVSNDRTQISRFFLEVYDYLADDVTASPGHDGKSVRKVTVDAIREEMKSRGILDLDDKGAVTANSRQQFSRAKNDLFASKVLTEKEKLIWRIGIVS
jgi:hypothetical protein